MNLFDRSRLNLRSLTQRKSKLNLDRMVDPSSSPNDISNKDHEDLEFIASSLKKTKEDKSPIVFAFGAHLIKNGLGKIMIALMQEGYVNHIVGNGAVSIHDWEFAYQGKTAEDVKHYLDEGQFGIWEETGKYINGAINQNSKLGYGKAVGKIISEERLGEKKVVHLFKGNSVLGNAFELGIPVSILTSIGQDIIYEHPDCNGAKIGEASYRDFLKFTKTMESFLTNGVYVSIGSAIMAPMVFEKSLSMVRNVSEKKGEFDIFVNDLNKSDWDWTKGEPSEDNPDYYLRFMKSFSRTSANNLKYMGLDNKDFLHNLYHKLR